MNIQGSILHEIVDVHLYTRIRRSGYLDCCVIFSTSSFSENFVVHFYFLLSSYVILSSHILHFIVLLVDE